MRESKPSEGWPTFMYRVSYVAPVLMLLIILVQAVIHGVSKRFSLAYFFLFLINFQAARFLYRRSFDLEAVFWVARVRPLDPDSIKFPADKIGVAGVIFFLFFCNSAALLLTAKYEINPRKSGTNPIKN